MKQLKNHLISTVGVLAIRIGKILPANFSPLGSFGFFSSNPSFYFLSILLFDYFFGGFYQGQIWVYLAFSIYPLFGYISRDKIKKQVLLLPLASLLFFLISNFGVWLNWYPKNIEGLIRCYILALPFYGRTLMGDLIFGYVYLIFKKYKIVKKSARFLIENSN
jgi:hypothetical protein